jgi:hypothetical protein
VIRRSDFSIGHRRYAARTGHRLDQDFLPLAVEFWRKQADPGDVAAGARKRLHQSCRNHVFDHSDQRHGASEILKCVQGRLRTGKDRIGRRIDQNCRPLAQMVVDVLKAAHDSKILSFNKAIAAKLIEKCDDRRRFPRGRGHDPKAIRAARLLPARGERPAGNRAAQKRDELTPSHDHTPQSSTRRFTGCSCN